MAPREIDLARLERWPYETHPRVTLVIPTLNEADGLEVVLPQVPALIDELIIVDGGSTDGTHDVALAMRPDVVFIRQTGRGKGDAIKTGLQHATGGLVVTMDGDGSMDPQDIPAFIDELLRGADFVKGSRVMTGASSDDFTAIRKAGNAALTHVANVLFGSTFTDITFGFNAYWRRVIVNPSQLSDGFQFEIQAAVRATRAGLRTVEVPCHEACRVGGASKLHAVRDGWRILKVILAEALPRRRVEFRTVHDLLHENALASPDPAVRVAS